MRNTVSDPKKERIRLNRHELVFLQAQEGFRKK